MEGNQYICPNCGDNISAHLIDFETRTATCECCRKQVTFKREAINQATHIVNDVRSAVNFFKAGNMESAKNCAEKVLSEAMDNVAALYIIHYYKAYCAPIKSFEPLDRFFKVEFDKIADLDSVEGQAFKELALFAPSRLADYEKEVLNVVIKTQGVAEAITFADQFCPLIINSRQSIAGFTPELFAIYELLTANGNIPKTWFALYGAMMKNPDSPFVTGAFYLKTKTERFYNNFILPLDKLLSGIQDPALKAKFYGAFSEKKRGFLLKMQQA